MSDNQDQLSVLIELTAQNAQKSQFISTVSHEFRTYVTALSMNIQMLEIYDAKWSPEKKATVFSRLRHSMKSMIQLLDQVSFLSKDIDGKLALSYSVFDVVSFCKEAVEKANHAAEFPATAVFTSGNVPPSVPTDSSLFNLIVTNLLSNALKFSRDGGQAELYLGLEGDTILVVRTTDTGIGIPQEALNQVYEPFFRAQNALQYPGSGLGLTVVRRAAGKLRGTVDLQSKPDTGTTVTVKLPIESAS